MNEYTGWHIVGMIATLVVLALIVAAIVSPKHVVSYYLSDKTGMNGSSLYLGVDIEWCDDQEIPLIGISYFDAARLVDSLNRSLPRITE